MGKKIKLSSPQPEVTFEGYMDSLEMEQTFNSAVDYPDDRPILEEPEEDFDTDEFLRVEDNLDDDLSEAEERSDIDDAQIESIISRVDLSDVQRQSMSFDDLMPKKVVRTGVINQRKEKKFQQGLLVIREAFILTPSVCKRTDCMFDAAQALGFKKAKDTKEKGRIIRRGTFWESVPEGKKKLVLTALKQHVVERHTHHDESMFDEADRPTSWLTSGSMLP